MRDFSKFERYEFGGPLGAAFIILFSHFSVYYLWVSVSYHHGAVLYPHRLSETGAFFAMLWAHVCEGARPTLAATAFYLGFLALQALFAVVLPGPRVKGMPVPSLSGRRLEYRCNGFNAWYATLALVAILHLTRVLPLGWIVDHLGPLLTVSILAGDALALYVFLEAKLKKTGHRESGNLLYDLFMGINLNPRIGPLDIKMFAEIRISWILLFLVTLSAAAKQYEVSGELTGGSAFMVVAHFLYANGCQKGEECIPMTWDIFHENFGWYLSFWNCAGVAFTYSFQAVYLYQNGPIRHSPAYLVLIYALLLGAYFIWDTSNSQKNRFRAQLLGTFVKRKTFPQMPWSTLKDPKYLTTRGGGTLLVDGWYRYARKIHYTADILMALAWGLACGFGHFLPYYYVCFFTVMITHRYYRDKRKMRMKYEEDYQRYCELVPHVFIPGVRKTGRASA